MILGLIYIFFGWFNICWRWRVECICSWWNRLLYFVRGGGIKLIVRIRCGRYWSMCWGSWKKMCIVRRVLVHTWLCFRIWRRLHRRRIIIRGFLLILFGCGLRSIRKVTLMRLHRLPFNWCMRGFWRYWFGGALLPRLLSPYTARCSSSATLRSLRAGRCWIPRVFCSGWSRKATFRLRSSAEYSYTCFNTYLCLYRRRKWVQLSSRYPRSSTR